MLVHLSAILSSFEFNLFPSIIFLYTSHIHKLLIYIFGTKVDYHSFSQRVSTGLRIPIQKVFMFPPAILLYFPPGFSVPKLLF